LLWYRSPWTQEDIIRRAGRLPLDKPFRTTFQYQSTMFTVAGFAVAKASGLSWSDFVQRRLLDPLDMKATYFTTTAIAKTADKASPYRLEADGKPAKMDLYLMQVPEPAGSIQSNIHDLSKWLLFHLNNKKVDGKWLVSPHNLEETHTPQIMQRIDAVDRLMFPETNQMSYGMGWVIQDYYSHRILQHAGLIDGFRCHFTLVPKERLGIVILSNLHQTRMNLALSNSLLGLLLKLPRRDWNTIIADAERQNSAAKKKPTRHANTKPSRELAAYAGAYEHPAYGTVRVSLKDGQLIWQWNQFRGELSHYHYNTFTLPIEIIGEPHVVFTLDADGTVSRMKVLGHMDVTFRRAR
jgi:CubicO group peptidase (beta-lactamase class C family)